MKKAAVGMSAVLLLALLWSCNVTDSNPNSIGGDTDIPMGQVGNEFSLGSINMGGSYVSVPLEATVMENEKGVAVINVKVDIDEIKSHSLYGTYNSRFNLDELINRIPQEYLDAQGNLDAEVKFKITSEGIQDYINRDNKPHTIVKYGAKVGDEFNLTKSGGQTLKRKVVQKSTDDDFPYGFMLIKTITIEQKSDYPGVSKFIYRANHKFGIVHVEAVFEDGSSMSSYVYSQN